MRLERIEVRHLRLPLRFPFETSFSRSTAKEFLLVAATADGITGYGECVADADPYYLPETNGTALHVLRDFLVPLAFSLEIGHPRELLPAFARVRGHEMAKAALEMAVWELLARREGAPLWRVLGGRGGTIASGVSVGLQKDAPSLVEKVEAEVAAGYRRIKIKIKPGHDRGLVAAIRARFPSLPLMVDANSAYTLADLPLFRELDAFGLMMVEQPLGWDDIVDHASLQRAIKTPVCLDESIHSADDARRALEGRPEVHDHELAPERRQRDGRALERGKAEGRRHRPLLQGVAPVLEQLNVAKGRPHHGHHHEERPHEVLHRPAGGGFEGGDDRGPRRPRHRARDRLAPGREGHHLPRGMAAEPSLRHRVP